MVEAQHLSWLGVHDQRKAAVPRCKGMADAYVLNHRAPVAFCIDISGEALGPRLL